MKRTLQALGVLIAGGILFLTYIGYFGGAVFTYLPAADGPKPRVPDVAAVILSGDMGFRIGMSPQIAQRLSANGVPVVGVNSLTYFANRSSPAGAEALLADAMRRALAFGHAKRLILIGQSFGADMLHVGLATLPPAMREEIAAVIFVVPTDTVYFQASPSELFSFGPPDARALPTASKVTWVPVTCIRGAEEADSLCPMLRAPNVKRVALPGGHNLKRDADRLYAAIFKAVVPVLFPTASPPASRTS